MLSRLRPSDHIDRVRSPRRPPARRPGPPASDPIDDLAAYRPAPAPAPPPVLPTSDPADIFLLTMGRWRRVCSWWLFSEEQLEHALSS